MTQCLLRVPKMEVLIERVAILTQKISKVWTVDRTEIVNDDFLTGFPAFDPVEANGHAPVHRWSVMEPHVSVTVQDLLELVISHCYLFWGSVFRIATIAAKQNRLSSWKQKPRLNHAYLP